MAVEQDQAKIQSAFEAARERVFSARDVQRASGLTARQLNDWDERGALPHDREGEIGWRRFSIREMFVLVVCAELRSKFGVSVERVKHVQKFMLQDGADHFAAAIRLMGVLGVALWLLTDFEGTFVMALVVGVGVLVLVHGKSAVTRRIGRRPSVFDVGTATRPACRLGP